MIKRILSFLALGLFLFTSCGKEEANHVDKGECYVSFNLSAVQPGAKEETPVGSQTKISQEDLLNPEDFSLELINSKGIVFKRWTSFREVKGQKIHMNAGNYTARAWYGDENAIGFDKTYFEGRENFIVTGQENKDVKVVCRQGNVAVKVVFGPQIQEDFIDYWATVKLKDSDTLKFLKDEKRTGFIPVGDGELYFRLHARDNKTGKVNVARKIISTAAADFITIVVDTKPIPTFDVSLNITIDAATDDRDVTIDIPSMMLPKDAPTLTSTGFVDNRIEATEGLSTANAMVNILSEAGIKKCILTVKSPVLKKAGWPETLDLTKLSSVQRQLLESYHFLYSSDMSDQTMAFIDFKSLSEQLKYIEGDANEYAFDIEITDIYDQSVKGSYVLQLNKAEFTVPALNPGNIWSSQVYADVQVTRANPALLVPEIRIPAGSWLPAEYTHETVAGTERFCLTSLAQNKDYEIRFTYNNASTAPMALKTETQLQVGNAGFEDWNTENASIKWGFSTYNFQRYYPYPSEASVENRWWDTNTKETTSNMSTPAEQRYKIFPTSAWTAGREGGKAAQLYSIAYDGTGVIKVNETPGRLFIGQAGNNGSVATKGHAFASRPTALDFYYQYESYNGDEFSARIEMYNGQTLIGSGEFRSNKSMNQWTQATANITYTDTQLKADKIYILFVTSTGAAPCRKVDVTIPEGTFNTWAGSKLLLDDIHLVYGK